MEKVAKLKDLKEGEGKTVTLLSGEEIALFRKGEEVFAIKDACPHMGASLSLGEVDEGKVFCPWHGWCFELKSGKCETLNGENTKAYQVVIEGQDVLIREE